MNLRLRISALPALLLLTAGGCVRYTPEALLPEQELASLRTQDITGFVVERVKVGEGLHFPNSHFDPSDGLDEGEVVAVALTLNPELRAKRLEIGEARALLISAGLWPNPEVGVGLKWGIGGAPGYNVDADALLQLLRPGERAARRAVATARVDEVSAEVVAAEFDTVGQVRGQWLEVLVAEQVVELLKEEVALRQRATNLVRERRRLGEGTELDVTAAELELAEIRRDLRQAETTLDLQRRELNRLTGLPPAYPLRLADSGKPLTISIFDNMADEELDRRLLAGRPELRAKHAAYQRAEQELRLAVLGQYPRLGIGPSFERELEGDNSLGGSLSLELPLFNRNQGEIAAARAARARTRAEYVALLHRLRANAHAARATLQRARAELETQEKEILPLVRRTQELFEGALGRRDISVFDWITAQQRTVRARREYLEALARYRTGVAQLEAATGSFLATPAGTQPSTRPAAEPATKPTARPG